MKTVWKFEIKPQAEQFVEMPDGAEILCVMTQGAPGRGTIFEGIFDRDPPVCLWAKVDPQAPTVSRRVEVHGTGHPIRTPALPYVGSFQLQEGRLVFHVFA